MNYPFKCWTVEVDGSDDVLKEQNKLEGETGCGRSIDPAGANELAAQSQRFIHNI